MKKLPQILTALIIVGSINVISCKAQTSVWRYKNVPDTYKQTLPNRSAFATEIQSLSASAYNVASSLPSGYVKDGSVDYTIYLQSALTTNRVIIFPDFPILVNHKGLTIPSETTVIFQKDSKLILQPNASTSYRILNIENANNVILYFPVIEGDRDKHEGTTGEWGMGISVKGSQNIKIINPNVSKCWGDGIYVGASSNTNSQNVLIKSAFLDNNRRNGISIVSGRNIRVFNSLISNTNGQNPKAGIDVEPNSNSDVLEGIVIQKLTSFNNEAFGIMVSPGSMKGQALKNIEISISNQLDDGSGVGLGMSLERTKKPLAGQALMGNIKIVDPVWKNNSVCGFQKGISPGSKIQVMIHHPSMLKNVGGKDVDDTQSRALMQKNVANDRNVSVQ